MSVIDKKPFIDKVLESLSTDQISKLKQLVNGYDDGVLFRSLVEGSASKLTGSDKTKGVFSVQLELSGNPSQKLYDGYLIYNNSYCVLISYSGMKNQQLTLINMKQDTNGIWSWEIMPCDTTILELRSSLYDDGSTADIINTVNEGIASGDINIPTEGLYKYKGTLTVAQINALNTSELETGDTYNISDDGIITLGSIEVKAGDNVTWTETGWDKLASTIEIPEGVQVVELSSASGTLTDEQYEKVMGDNCIIIWQQYSGATKYIFYKKSIRSNVVDYTAINFYFKFEGYYRTQIFRINISSKTYMLVNSNINNAEEGTLPVVSANPTLLGSEVALTSLQVGLRNYKVVGEEPDADVTVEIESDYTNDDYQNRTNYATAISLKDFIANCEAGNVYTNEGTIAKINNLIDGKAFRIILIGTNHDVLAYDDTTVAKTTWQFLDMPEHNVRLGLPFNVIDWGSSNGKDAAMDYLLGINSSSLTWYPSNKGGYVTAVGLLNALHTIYEGLPIQLKRAIKTVRKAFIIPRQRRSVAANGGTESDTNTTGYIAQKLFHLSATENNNTDYGTEGTTYSYLNSSARRIRYYNNSAVGYWSSTSPSSDSSRWLQVTESGNIAQANNFGAGAVAPAFCI